MPGLSLNPPTNTVVLSMDENTQIQALERTQPLLPLQPDLPVHHSHDYRRHGLTSLYAALEMEVSGFLRLRPVVDNRPST